MNLFLILMAVLLRYNLVTIKFILLERKLFYIVKCKHFTFYSASIFLVYSQSSATPLPNLEYFHHCKKESLPITPSHKTFTTNNLLSILIDFIILDISYKQNFTICSLFCLAYFTLHNDFKVHPYYSKFKDFMSFYN